MDDHEPTSAPRLIDLGRAETLVGKRVCCFTTVFKDWDYLKEIPPPYREPWVDYFCFTDDPTLESESWRVVYVGHVENGREANRLYKQLWVHPLQQQGYDYFVYLDATLFVRTKLTSLLDILELGRSDLVGFYYTKSRAPWNGLLAIRNSERFTRFAKAWHEMTMRDDRRMPDGRVRDEYVYWETLQAFPDLRVNLLPYSALPQYALTIHHKPLSIAPRLEKRVLSDWPVYRLGWLGVPIIFVGGFMFRRHKLGWLRRTLEKARGWV